MVNTTITDPAHGRFIYHINAAIIIAAQKVISDICFILLIIPHQTSSPQLVQQNISYIFVARKLTMNTPKLITENQSAILANVFGAFL